MSWGGDNCGFGRRVGRTQFEHRNLSQSETVAYIAHQLMQENDMSSEEALIHAHLFVVRANMLTVVVGPTRLDASVWHGGWKRSCSC